jgi:3-hydroxyacyl-[acyl-carrier-protein] dehydratase
MRWFWIDRFTEYVTGTHAVAIKGVTLSDGFLHDHFDVYPVMPPSLIAEGMAQTGGLLVSEIYKFAELVVLAKFSKLAFEGEVRGGAQIVYRADIGQLREVGAMVDVVASVDGQQVASAEIFFARLAGDAADAGMPKRLFDPADLVHWLHLVGVFEVGTRPDGSRIRVEDYGLPSVLAGTAD